MDYPEIRDPIVLRFSMRVAARFVRVRGGSAPPADPPEPRPGEFHFLLPAGVEPFVDADGELRLRRMAPAGEPSQVPDEAADSKYGHAASDRASLVNDALNPRLIGTALKADWLGRVGAGL